MLTNEETTTAAVLAGLMTIPFLLALVSVWLWVALRRPGTAPGHPQSRPAHATGAAADIAGDSGRSASAIAVQPVPGEPSRYDHRAGAVADPRAGAEDDTDLDYYDTPSGNIWRADARPSRTAAKVLARPGLQVNEPQRCDSAGLSHK